MNMTLQYISAHKGLFCPSGRKRARLEALRQSASAVCISLFRCDQDGVKGAELVGEIFWD